MSINNYKLYQNHFFRELTNYYSLEVINYFEEKYDTKLNLFEATCLYTIIYYSARNEEALFYSKYFRDKLKIKNLYEVLEKISKLLNVEIGNYSKYTYKCRSLQINQNEAFLILNDLQQFRISKISKNKVEGIIKENNQLKKIEYNLEKEEIKEYTKYVNNITYPELIKLNLNNLINNSKVIDAFAYENMLTKIYQRDIIFSSRNDYRIYNHLQIMPKIEKSKVYKGCFDIDLKSAHIVIFAGIFNIKKVNDILRDEKDIYEIIAHDVGATREQIKLFFLGFLKGAGPIKCKINLIKDKKLREGVCKYYKSGKVKNKLKIPNDVEMIYNNLMKNKIILDIKDKLNEIKYMYMNLHDAFGNKIEADNYRSALTKLCNSYEKIYAFEVMKYCKKFGGRVLLDMHDGWIIYNLKDFDRLNKIIINKGKDHNMVMNLKVKEL